MIGVCPKLSVSFSGVSSGGRPLVSSSLLNVRSMPAMVLVSASQVASRNGVPRMKFFAPSPRTPASDQKHSAYSMCPCV